MLNFICPINGETGYSIAALSTVDALHRNICKVSLFSTNNEQSTNIHPKYHNSIRESIQNGQFFDVNADCIRCYHQFSMDMFVGRGRHIAWPFFELDRFTPIEKHHLSSVDEIFVSSRWASNIIQRELGRESKVIPLGVDRELFPDKPIPRNNTTVFTMLGKFEKRKHDIILPSFEKAFRPDDNVQLWSMNDNICKPDENQKWQSLYRQSNLSDKIKFIPRQSSVDMVSSIMANSHFGLFPSHAEGWNLELLEMMSVGRYSIATDYSAHTEYTDNINSYLVEVRDTEPANDGIWFSSKTFDDGAWAKLDDIAIEDTANHMRTMYEKHQSGEDIFNYEGVKTANEFTWDNTASEIYKTLSLT